MTKEEKKEWAYNYYRSMIGVITRLYGNQKVDSKRRGHPAPEYTKKELIVWMYENDYETVFNEWVDSDYEKMLRPSCDRLDDSLHYTLDNIRLVTWKENDRKAKHDMRTGKIKTTFTHRRINQLTMKGIKIREFMSLMDAQRTLNISNGNISGCCNGKRKSAGGFKWEYTT